MSVFKHNTFRINYRGSVFWYIVFATNTIEQTNSLCQSYINPVYRVKRGKAFMYRNYFCTPEPFRHLTKCLGHNYDKLAEKRFQLHPILVMFSFNKATHNDRKDTCDYWSKEVSRHFYVLQTRQKMNTHRLTRQFIQLSYAIS
jgi:hypothetical protein